ncbi:NUDIX hydrolase [Paramagnetospirillum caucaseum]|uniref:GDP-mannose pyrophosphatase n=1 Tax=Paramagnetospirillum caucaseum TaxID=1244869 RepID=M2YF04_9PROT|nr:NUDIX hydrolase [Paramagnetospirillum caucaseum]EME71551.1 NUDIX hydrolase [Paramagnetospirillum caucaseum]
MTPPKPPAFRVAFATPFFSIEETAAERPGELPHYRLVASDGAICLPFTPQGDVLLVRQYRHCLGRQTLEVPSGGVDGGEGCAAAAVREIAEETAHAVSGVRLLGIARPQLNRNTQREFFMLAFDATPIPGAAPEAGIELVRMTRGELARAIRTGELEQPAAIGFIGLASVKLGLDILSAPMDEIKARAETLPKGENEHEG